MKTSSKKDDKLCFILHTISSLLFMASGVLSVINDGFSEWTGITNIALGITFASLAVIYYKKYKAK